MKLLILLVIIFTGCTSFSETKTEMTVEECIQQQVDLFGDLCSESSVGYEEMNGSEAFYEGVKCAVQSSLWCLEAEGYRTLPVMKK